MQPNFLHLLVTRAKDFVFVGDGRSIKDNRPVAFHRAFRVTTDDPIAFDPKEISGVRKFMIDRVNQEISVHPDRFHSVFVQIFTDRFV